MLMPIPREAPEDHLITLLGEEEPCHPLGYYDKLEYQELVTIFPIATYFIDNYLCS